MSETGDIKARLRGVWDRLTPGAIDTADLDGMAWVVSQAADHIEALEAERDAECTALTTAEARLSEALARAERLSKEMLSAANICDVWADESRNGGWSTHQVAPNRRLADALRRAVLSEQTERQR